MYRKDYQIVLRIVTVAILSALGFVLMAFAQIPYPIAPWLKIEFSDVTVLISYVLFSFPGALVVAILKTVLDISIHGLSGAYGIGNITALITSLTYVLSLYVTSHILRLFNKTIWYRIIGYIIISLFVSTILVLLNALFITPTYLSGSFTTCFNKEVREGVISALGGSNYFIAILVLYFPFNLFKASSICVIYEILFNRRIFVLFRRNEKIAEYFIRKPKEIIKEVDEPPIENNL